MFLLVAKYFQLGFFSIFLPLFLFTGRSIVYAIVVCGAISCCFVVIYLISYSCLYLWQPLMPDSSWFGAFSAAVFSTN